jgi:hypothetical protein
MSQIDIYARKPVKGLPCDPCVNICLTSCTKNVDSPILLSPDLMGDQEVDESVDYLIKQLEAARKKAKRILKKQEEKLLLELDKRISKTQ